MWTDVDTGPQKYVGAPKETNERNGTWAVQTAICKSRRQPEVPGVKRVLNTKPLGFSTWGCLKSVCIHHHAQGLNFREKDLMDHWSGYPEQLVDQKHVYRTSVQTEKNMDKKKKKIK